MSGDKRIRLKEWLESGAARLESLTFPQRELWEASPVPPGDIANHICCVVNARGAITARAFETAVQRVVERHETLRLSFLPGKERPVQMIRATGEAAFQFRELSPSETGAEVIEAIAGEIFRAPFDLLQGPLYRVAMLSRSADDHLVVIAFHHAIADGWSLGVFIHDLCAAYVQGMMGVREPLPPVPLSYSAWGAAERALWPAAEIAQRAAFWKSQLDGTRRLWNAHNTGAPQRWVSSVPADLGQAARELARRHGVTLFTALLAPFQIALSQWTGADDITVGTPVANRAQPTVRETIGYCAGIVPLRGRIEHSRKFFEVLRDVHHATMDCFANAIPFAELVQVLGEPPSPGRNPVFDVRFALQNHPIPDINLPGLSARLRMRSTGTARFSLACELTEQGDALEVAWLSWRNMFSEHEIQKLDRIFQTVLAGACRSPESRIAELMT